METPYKVLTLNQLAEHSRILRGQGQRVVLCHGVFDLLHPGHLRHLQEAGRQGDVLMVTVTADRYVNKGPGRPIFPHLLRAESLASLACVDFVAINDHPSAVPVIHQIKPDVYIKGQDYKSVEQDITGKITLEKDAVESHGGRLYYTNEITFSSTSLINDHFDVFSPSTKAYLKQFQDNCKATALIARVQTLREKRVLVIGEAIIDEYCYATPMGLTGKSGNILAAKFESIEQFAGGSLAVANHLAEFVTHITLLTGLGRDERHETFIRSRLAANVTPQFFYFGDAPTLVKRRFVDDDMNKLFELYYYDDDPLSPATEAQIRQWIHAHAPGFDIVIVPDYGNGLISNGMVAAICQTAPFLAVNTQINSGNRGHHVITRYPRVDFASLNEPELRLATHSRRKGLEELTSLISSRIQARQFAVTLGISGALLLDNDQKKFLRSPALSTKVVDRIGAGDAFFAFASLGLGSGLSSEESLFLGSAAAALDVQFVCNRETVSLVPFFKFITTLLK